MSELEDRDWKQLLPELIHLIAKKLPDVLNFIHFRSVCKAWQSFAPLSDPPTQFPWIYHYPQVDSDTDSDEARCLLQGPRFYSISSAETLMINVRAPDVDRNDTDFIVVCCHNIPFIYEIGPSDYFSHCADLYLYNPLTRKQFALEGVPLPLFKPIIAWTGTNPICNRSMLIVDEDLKFHRDHEGKVGLAFFDPHRTEWIVHKGSFSNAFFCQGKLFTIEADNYTLIWDLSPKMLCHRIPPPDNEIKPILDDKEIKLQHKKRHTYILESSGIILRVYWIINENWQRENSIFHIYKLQFDGVNMKPCWIKLNNIGKQVLFLDAKIAFSMSARPSTGFKEGCIYFLSFYHRKPYVYDVLTGTIEMVCVPSSFECCSWFVPGLC